jgi:glycosyltransferase involved in cell wall biosynthesis
MTGISAVVATYKRKFELERLLRSVLDDSAHLEMIIVDQNTDNLIDDLVAAYAKSLQIIHLKVAEANQSKARNHGAQHASMPVICFPDDDCWFDHDSVKNVIAYFDNNEKTDLLIINWRQKAIDGNSTSALLTKKIIYSYKAPVNYGMIALFFRREPFFKLGGLIEDIGIGKYIGAGEDAEILFRSAKKGLQIFYEARIFINHHYTHDEKRSVATTRSRQRAPGFIYSRYGSPYVVIRGLVSPLFKMIFSPNMQSSKIYYNTFLARFEGLLYGFRHRTNNR